MGRCKEQMSNPSKHLINQQDWYCQLPRALILNMRSESTWTSTCSEDDLTAMLRMYLPNEYLEFTPQCNNDLITILVGSTSQVGVTLYVLYCTHLNTFIYNIYLFINN